MELNECKNQIREFFVKIPGIDYLFLFGSALKTLRPESDIDILISGQLTIEERLKLSVELGEVFKRKVDLVAVEEASNELIREAIPRGVPILVNNREKLKSDYLQNFYRYDDNTNLRELRRQRLKRSYSGGQ